MTSVRHYIAETKQMKICPKGGVHEGQGLNLVCLSPLCRSNPLACASCFTEIHKYHKVMSLNKFLDDYKRNIGSCNPNMQEQKVSKHFKELQKLLADLRRNANRRFDQFEQTISKYASFLADSSHIRDSVGKQLGIELDPDRITQSCDLHSLSQSLKFILNNSLFDSNLNMVTVTDLLKQNQDRVFALLDKMVYMTEFCQKTVEQAFKGFNFAGQTLKEEQSAIREQIDRINRLNDDPSCLHEFLKKRNRLAHINPEENHLIFEDSQKTGREAEFDQLNMKLDDCILYKFGKNKHTEISIKNRGQTAVSNVTALKPYYAFAHPNLNTEPMRVRKWSIKVHACRDLSSNNTMALGIGRLSDAKLAGFQGSPTNCLLVSSQGFVIANGNHQKTKFSYQQGDVLHFEYDPYYNLLQISKDNGRKLCLKALGFCANDPLYACARLTYASDEVELL